jgi:hypothetical protein
MVPTEHCKRSGSLSRTVLSAAWVGISFPRRRSISSSSTSVDMMPVFVYSPTIKMIRLILGSAVAFQL